MLTPKSNHSTARVCSQWNEVCFQPDLIYLFAELNNKHHAPLMLSSEEVQLSKDMINAWTTFAKQGRVRNRINSRQYWNSAFERATEPNTRFILLDVKNSTMITNGFYNRTCNHFWMNKLLDDTQFNLAQIHPSHKPQVK